MTTAIMGVVTDSSGAVVTGAHVCIRNEATDQVSTTTTDAQGQFRVGGIPPGAYDVTVTSAGFAIATQTGVISSVGVESSVNISLAPGTGGQGRLGFGTLITSRELLADSKCEEKGLGLYSYILFGSPPPNDATHERYVATLKSFLAIPSTREMVKYVPKGQLNITYVPIHGIVQPSSAEELLKVYNYERASDLLARISCNQGAIRCGPYLAGPYIISTTKPLSEQTSLSVNFLYQDISSVPARIVPLWVDEFMKQSAQPQFWQKRKGPQVALELRTAIAIAADGTPDVEHSADSWKKALAMILVWK
jgi:hypothetical protein